MKFALQAPSALLFSSVDKFMMQLFDSCPAVQCQELGIQVQPINPNSRMQTIGQFAQNCFQILYFPHAGGQYRYQGHRQTIQAGDVVLTSPRDSWNWITIEQAQGWGIWFTGLAINPYCDQVANCPMLTNSAILQPFFQIKGHSFHLPNVPQSLWMTWIDALYGELLHQKLGYQDAARAYLTQGLVQLSRSVADALGAVLQPQDPLMLEIHQYIDTHYRDAIALNDIAKCVNLSPAYLSSLIHKTIGRTLSELIRDRRMEAARRLLLETDNDINSIGIQVGYPSATYFARQFRKVHEQTPSVWRQMKRLKSAS